MPAESRVVDPGDALVQLVGRRVREVRQAKKLSQTAVATRLGMANTNYARIEAGKQNLTLATLARLAGVLGVRPADLLRERSGVRKKAANKGA